MNHPKSVEIVNGEIGETTDTAQALIIVTFLNFTISWFHRYRGFDGIARTEDVPCPNPVESGFNILGLNMPSTQDLYDDWMVNKGRPVFLIDESREDATQQGGQFILYTCVVTTAHFLTTFLREAAVARAQLPSQSNKVNFKGHRLFGNRARKAHEPMRRYMFDCLKRVEAIVMMMTSSNAVSSSAKSLIGGITALVGHGETGRAGKVFGPELVPMLNFLKKIANDLKLGPGQIDVLIDRSAQLGLSPTERGLEPTQFESFGPDSFNEGPDGKPSILQCPSSFRLISIPDEGQLGDLVSLPDAVGYLGFQGSSFEVAKKEVLKGNSFWVWYADLTELRDSSPP